MAKDSGHGQKAPPAPIHRAPPALDEEDEAPESVSLATSRKVAISQFRAAKDAATRRTAQDKERRRVADTLLKTQAAVRKERLAQIVASLTTRTKSPKRTSLVAATKRISLEEEEEEEDLGDNHHRSLEKLEVQVRPGERIVHLSAIAGQLPRLRQQRATTLARSKEMFLGLRTMAHRVDASVSMARRRLGRPAVKFVLTAEEAAALRLRLQGLVNAPKKLKLRNGSDDK